MTFNVREAIQYRKSVRSFSNKIISSKDISKINLFIKELSPSPFSSSISFQVLENVDKNINPATYGFISGASQYLICKSDKANISWLDIGYQFEKIILFLTSIEIASCWLGGTFNRKNLSDQLDLKSNEIIPAITPIGYKNRNSTIRDKLLRKIASADRRKPISEVILNYSDLKNEYLSQLIDLAILAPSASNRQPWRIIIDNELIHIYLKRTKNYKNIIPGIDLQMIDMGIFISHLIETLIYDNRKYKIKTDIGNKKTGIEYVISLQLLNN